MSKDEIIPAKTHFNGTFLTGIFLLLLGITIILSLRLDQTQYIFLKILVCLAAGLIGTQIPGMVGYDTGTGIKAGGAVALVLIFYFITPGRKPEDFMTLTIKVFDNEERPVGEGRLKIVFDKGVHDYHATIDNGRAVIPELPTQYQKFTFRIIPEMQGYFLKGPNTYRLNEQVLTITLDQSGHTITTQHTDLPEKRFAVLLSGNIRYTQDILQGLTQKLHELVHQAGFYPYIESISGSEKGIGTPEGLQEYKEALKILFEKQPFDYYVSIGTQASQAMRQYIDSAEKNVRHLFLGVTDPVDAGLVPSLVGRTDNKHVAGIGYCGPVETIAYKINELFPEKPLVFFYSNDYPQDVSIANRLQHTSLVQNGVLRIRHFETLPTVTDFLDSTAIYFSWYTLEKMLEQNMCRELLARRILVASTVANVKEAGLSPVAITTNDKRIGSMGAHIIRNDIAQPGSFRRSNVQIPGCEIYINCRTLAAKGLQLNPAALPAIQGRFSCETTATAHDL